jgi:nitric oxide synthase oxygenase domain/subunit
MNVKSLEFIDHRTVDALNHVLDCIEFDAERENSYYELHEEVERQKHVLASARRVRGWMNSL